MWLTVFNVAIILIIVAMTRTEGFWGNLLLMFNAIFAAILASNLFEPAARFMDNQAGSFTYFWGFLCLWVLFAMIFAILRATTDQISETKVRFKFPVELPGGIIASLICGWIVVCFFLFSLHTAPLARTNFKNAFGTSPDASHFFMSPDHLWLGFMQSRSETTFAKSEPSVFDPDSDFILKYGHRRERLENMPGMTVDTRNRRRRN